MTGVERVSVGIASRGRPESLARCIASLTVIDEILDEVIVIDDGSEQPLEQGVRALLTACEQARLRFVRFDPPQGLAAARSEGVFRARSPLVLNLDDDAQLVSGDAVQAARRTITADPSIAAVAFAQAQADGSPWPTGAQPAPVDYPCHVASFIGFAHLVRRETFAALGGFRAQLGINGEEREFCLRALDAGFHVVYLPEARVAHLADPAGRDVRRYLHLTVRNGVLASIYDDPLPVLAVRVPMRLVAYFRMRRAWTVHDPGGFRTILAWIRRDLGAAIAQRRAVRWGTIRRWRQLTREFPPYQGPA
jgi:GT2 family glycosyltransferase